MRCWLSRASAPFVSPHCLTHSLLPEKQVIRGKKKSNERLFLSAYSFPGQKNLLLLKSCSQRVISCYDYANVIMLLHFGSRELHQCDCRGLVLSYICKTASLNVPYSPQTSRAVWISLQESSRSTDLPHVDDT